MRLDDITRTLAAMRKDNRVPALIVLTDEDAGFIVREMEKHFQAVWRERQANPVAPKLGVDMQIEGVDVACAPVRRSAVLADDYHPHAIIVMPQSTRRTDR